MSNRDGYGLELPSVIDPPDTVCYQVEIPNDPAYIAAFLGSIYYLGQWVAWQRDLSHRGTLAAQKFKDIFQNLKPISCKTPVVTKIYESGDEMPFRIDCNCNVFAECCDGTEVQLATTKMLPGSGSAGSGTPQPSTGGGHQQYCQKLDANHQMLIPTPLNTGDTIELISADGSWWDGGENALGFPVWRCPDGEYYFAGNCQGTSTKRVTGTDPAVAAAHMALIVIIGSTAYDLTSGIFTVPSGVTNATAVIQVNDTDITNNQGSADVCIKVTNNQLGTWEHTFDFTASAGGWVNTPSGDPGTWVGGVGWETLVYIAHGSPPQNMGIDIEHSGSGSPVITSIEVTFDLIAGSPPASAMEIRIENGATSTVVFTESNVFGNHTVVMATPWTTAWTHVRIDAFVDRQDVTPSVFSKVVVKGTGTDPF